MCYVSNYVSTHLQCVGAAPLVYKVVVFPGPFMDPMPIYKLNSKLRNQKYDESNRKRGLVCILKEATKVVHRSHIDVHEII